MHFFAWSIHNYRSLDARIFQPSINNHGGKIYASSGEKKRNIVFHYAVRKLVPARTNSSFWGPMLAAYLLSPVSALHGQKPERSKNHASPPRRRGDAVAGAPKPLREELYRRDERRGAGIDQHCRRRRPRYRAPRSRRWATSSGCMTRRGQAWKASPSRSRRPGGGAARGRRLGRSTKCSPEWRRKS